MTSALTQSGGVGGLCGREGKVRGGGSTVVASLGFDDGDLFLALGDVGTYLHEVRG